MKFVDEVTLWLKAGSGGAGCVSFHREKFVPKGGPDGGNGGKGGSIFLQLDNQLNTLVDYKFQSHFKAPKGIDGSGRNRFGANGEDLYLKVPPGTLAFDNSSGKLIAEIKSETPQQLILKGGRGGVGNKHFASSTNQAPKYAQPGEPGEELAIRLELRLLADVGTLGLPNAGKSSLVRSLSAAKPKIADYPFTTLVPSLGVVFVDTHKSFVITDIPGLIAGAHQGKGLGMRFLKHLCRNRVLLHLVDISHTDLQQIQDEISLIEKELAEFSSTLSKDIPRWLVLSKLDTLPEEVAEKLKSQLQQIYPTRRIFCTSSMSKQGLKELTFALQDFLEKNPSNPDVEMRLLEEAHLSLKALRFH